MASNYEGIEYVYEKIKRKAGITRPPLHSVFSKQDLVDLTKRLDEGTTRRRLPRRRK